MAMLFSVLDGDGGEGVPVPTVIQVIKLIEKQEAKSRTGLTIEPGGLSMDRRKPGKGEESNHNLRQYHA